MNEVDKKRLIDKLYLMTTQSLKHELKPYVIFNIEAANLLNNLPNTFRDGDKSKRINHIINSLDTEIQVKLYEKIFELSPISNTIYPVNSEITSKNKIKFFKFGKSKLRGRIPSPKRIKFFTFAMGSIVLALGFVMAYLGHRCNVILLSNGGWLIGGLGASILSAAVISWLWDIMKSSSAWRMLEESMYANWSEFSKIRYDQEVEMTFLLEENKLKVNTKHSFKYKISELREYNKKFCEISIFSDFQPVHFEKNAKVGAFHFELIKIGLVDFHELRWGNAVRNGEDINLELKKILSDTKNGKLSYESGRLSLPDSDYLSIDFEICGIYECKDRIVWIFQELSEGTVIKINRSELPENSILYISINHPLAGDILKASGNKNIVDSSTGKILTEIPDISVKIDKSILPYQGFEVHWDVSPK